MLYRTRVTRSRISSVRVMTRRVALPRATLADFTAATAPKCVSASAAGILIGRRGCHRWHDQITKCHERSVSSLVSIGMRGPSPVGVIFGGDFGLTTRPLV